jgi:hypothetical protein
MHIGFSSRTLLHAVVYYQGTTVSRQTVELVDFSGTDVNISSRVTVGTFSFIIPERLMTGISTKLNVKNEAYSEDILVAYFACLLISSNLKESFQFHHSPM